jgi:ribonuclease T
MGAADNVWISVDVEASGASPSTGSLISIGACLVERPEATFYVELQPLPDRPWDEAAEKVHGLGRAHLAEHGIAPAPAMARFAEWIAQLPEVRAGGRPLFVGFNATFDWMWVADWFHAHLGHNPFGISGLDLKAFALGRHWDAGMRGWGETAKRNLRRQYPTPAGLHHTHNALDDALEQADLARQLRSG